MQVPISISDSNYKDVPISADRFEQTISPQAEFHLDPRHHRGTGRKDIWTCQTNTTDVHFTLKVSASEQLTDLRGPTFNVDVEIVSCRGRHHS